MTEFGGWRRWWFLFKARENSHTDVRCLKWEGSMTVAAAGGCLLWPPSRDRQAAPPLVSSSLRYPDLKWLTSVWMRLRVISRQWYRLWKTRIMRQICSWKWHFSLILNVARVSTIVIWYRRSSYVKTVSSFPWQSPPGLAVNIPTCSLYSGSVS